MAITPCMYVEMSLLPFIATLYSILWSHHDWINPLLVNASVVCIFLVLLTNLQWIVLCTLYFIIFTSVYLEYIPRSGIAESNGTLPQSSIKFFIPPAMHESCFSTTKGCDMREIYLNLVLMWILLFQETLSTFCQISFFYEQVFTFGAEGVDSWAWEVCAFLGPASYLRGKKQEKWVAPMQARPCLMGL